MKIIILSMFFSLLFCSVASARFYDQDSTWYVEIPDNPDISANGDYGGEYPTRIEDAICDNYPSTCDVNDGELSFTYRWWSVPIFYAEASDPLVTVDITATTQIQIDRIDHFEWNLNVPMPPEARPSGWDECGGTCGYHDDNCVIISEDGNSAWEMFQFQHDTTPNVKAKLIKKFDLTGHGIQQPYPDPDVYTSPMGGNTSFAPRSELSSLVTYDEVALGVVDHAITMAYKGTGTYSSDNIQEVYPFVISGRDSDSSDEDGGFTPKIGQRYQLDPDIDVTTLGLSTGTTVIARALQVYGMVFAEHRGNVGVIIRLEDLEYDATRDWHDAEVDLWDGTFSGDGFPIPINHGDLRLIEPLYPSSAISAYSTSGSFQ